MTIKLKVPEMFQNWHQKNTHAIGLHLQVFGLAIDRFIFTIDVNFVRLNGQIRPGVVEDLIAFFIEISARSDEVVIGL